MRRPFMVPCLGWKKNWISFLFIKNRENGPQTYVLKIHLFAVIVELDWHILAEFEMFYVNRLLVAVPRGCGRVR